MTTLLFPSGKCASPFPEWHDIWTFLRVFVLNFDCSTSIHPVCVRRTPVSRLRVFEWVSFYCKIASNQFAPKATISFASIFLFRPRGILRGEWQQSIIRSKHRNQTNSELAIVEKPQSNFKSNQHHKLRNNLCSLEWARAATRQSQTRDARVHARSYFTLAGIAVPLLVGFSRASMISWWMDKFFLQSVLAVWKTLSSPISWSNFSVSAFTIWIVGVSPSSAHFGSMPVVELWPPALDSDVSSPDKPSDARRRDGKQPMTLNFKHSGI